MIIGIGGISRSGKSSLSAYIKKQLGSSCTEIHMDQYIKDSAHWDFLIKKPVFYLSKIHKKFDLAHPQTIIDFDRLYDDIKKAGEQYEWVIAEGSYICYDNRIKALFDRYIHVTINKENFIQRRLQDYKKENRWYAKHLWSSFIRYGNNYAGLNYMLVEGDLNIDTKAVLGFINAKKHVV